MQHIVANVVMCFLEHSVYYCHIIFLVLMAANEVFVFGCICCDVCFHGNITGKQLQLYITAIIVKLSGYIGNAIHIVLSNFKFATWQHPAVGRDARFAVPHTLFLCN